MTRADLLAYLLKSDDRTPAKLTKVFGMEWAEPMHSLIALGVIVPHQMSKRGAETLFYVVGWKGKNDSPTFTHQAVSRSQEAE